MVDYRKILCPSAIIALVLLRLVIGWHFYDQGMEKFSHDPETKRYAVDFSAAPFLSGAQGPLAGLYHVMVPENHGWQRLLAAPRQDRLPTTEETAEQASWVAEYKRSRDAAAKEKQPVPVEFPPFAPYADWADKIAADWTKQAAAFQSAAALAPEQQGDVDGILQTRKQRLADYLADETEAIAEYQHELWRLDQWRNSQPGDGAPFQAKRIATKAAETARAPASWIGAVGRFEQAYHAELLGLMSADQRASAELMSGVDRTLSDPRQRWLEWVSITVAVAALGVGICLLVGFFTRLASWVGALFLLGVVLSQPPWVPGTQETIYQTVELAGLLVLAGTGAGRWFGFDYFTHLLFGRRKK